MILRIFWGFVLGTVINAGVFYVLVRWNGTPVPSARTPVALLGYPTGSMTATLVFAWFAYLFALLVTCFLIPRKNVTRMLSFQD